MFEESFREIVAAYDREAANLASRYAHVKETIGEPWWAHGLPGLPARVLDVGAGTGLDAAWLSRHGYDVVAAEPSREMTRIGRELTNAASVTWIEDALPELNAVRACGEKFDFLLCSAVLQHVPEELRSHAVRSFAALTRGGAAAAILLRDGPSPAGRRMFPMNVDAVCEMAIDAGFTIEERSTKADPMSRVEVSWTQLLLRAA